MHPHEAILHRFYERFAALDADAMEACYHPDATFSDPVFPDLRGRERIGAMWRMLKKGAQGFRLEFGDVRADDAQGSVRWQAEYVFGKARRPVCNVVDARFAFRDGLIYRHVDAFDLWRWSRMALGAPGVVLGWTPFLQARIRRDAAARLARFEAQAPAKNR